jgi:hypothetical protein
LVANFSHVINSKEGKSLLGMYVAGINGLMPVTHI